MYCKYAFTSDGHEIISVYSVTDLGIWIPPPEFFYENKTCHLNYSLSY